MRWTALIPLIGLMFLLFARGISSTYLKSLLLQACDRLVFRLFSANSKSSRADLISTLPRITTMSPWFFNNPPAASCGPFPWQLSKKFLIFFLISKFLYGFNKISEAIPAFTLALATVAEFVHDSDIIMHRVQVFWYWLLNIMYKLLIVFFVRWYNVKMFAYYIYYVYSTHHLPLIWHVCK